MAHVVIINSPTWEHMHELYMWCRDNTPNNDWCHTVSDRSFHQFGYRYTTYFRFQNEEDAVMFKLSAL